jgi:hypothetical protein
MALTSLAREALAVEHPDAAAAVEDQALVLQGAGEHRDAGALHAEHLGEELLGQQQFVLSGVELRAQDPGRQPLRDAVLGVAGGGLLRLRQRVLLVAEDKVADTGRSLGELDQVVGLDDPAIAGKLGEGGAQMRAPAEQRAAADHAAASHHARLDAIAVIEIHNERDHPGTWKQEFVNRTSGFAEDVAMDVRDLARVPRHEIGMRLVESSKNLVVMHRALRP